MSIASLRPLSIPVVASFALTACFDNDAATSAADDSDTGGGPLARPDTGGDGSRDTGGSTDDAGSSDGGRPGLDAVGDDAGDSAGDADGGSTQADTGGGGGDQTVRAYGIVREHAGVICRGTEGCDPYGFAYAYSSVEECVEAFYAANSPIFVAADEACVDALEEYVLCSTANVSCELDYYTFAYRFGLADGECVAEFDAFDAACNPSP